MGYAHMNELPPQHPDNTYGATISRKLAGSAGRLGGGGALGALGGGELTMAFIAANNGGRCTRPPFTVFDGFDTEGGAGAVLGPASSLQPIGLRPRARKRAHSMRNKHNR